MSKLAMFLAGMLLGLFLSLYHIRSQQIREYNLGPQPTGHAADDDDESFNPCARWPADQLQAGSPGVGYKTVQSRNGLITAAICSRFQKGSVRI